MTTRRTTPRTATTKKKPSKVAKAATASKVEGEGNRTADRNYRKGIQKFLKTANPTAIARKAAKEIDADEAKDTAKKKPVAKARGFLRIAFQQIRDGVGSMVEMVKRWREPRTNTATR